MASEFRSWTRQGSSSEAWERLTSATSMALACWWRSHPQHQERTSASPTPADRPLAVAANERCFPSALIVLVSIRRARIEIERAHVRCEWLGRLDPN